MGGFLSDGTNPPVVDVLHDVPDGSLGLGTLASKVVEADGTLHTGGLLAGDGYHAAGILDGTTHHASGIVSGAGVFSASGILSGAGAVAALTYATVAGGGNIANGHVMAAGGGGGTLPNNKVLDTAADGTLPAAGVSALVTGGALAAAKIRDDTYGSLDAKYVMVAATGAGGSLANAKVLDTQDGGTLPATSVLVAAGGTLVPDYSDVANTLTTDTTNGVAGTFDATIRTLISGVAAAADVRSATPRYTGGPNGTLGGIFFGSASSRLCLYIEPPADLYGLIDLTDQDAFVSDSGNYHISLRSQSHATGISFCPTAVFYGAGLGGATSIRVGNMPMTATPAPDLSGWTLGTGATKWILLWSSFTAQTGLTLPPGAYAGLTLSSNASLTALGNLANCTFLASCTVNATGSPLSSATVNAMLAAGAVTNGASRTFTFNNLCQAPTGNMAVSGMLSPDVTGEWTQIANYAAHPCWSKTVGATTWYLWWFTTGSIWQITDTQGMAGSSGYWLGIGANPWGDYTPDGVIATGTATVTGVAGSGWKNIETLQGAGGGSATVAWNWVNP